MFLGIFLKSGVYNNILDFHIYWSKASTVNTLGTGVSIVLTDYCGITRNLATKTRLNFADHGETV